MKRKLKLIIYALYGKFRRYINQLNSISSYEYNAKIAQKKVFVFWTGDNELTENRKLSIIHLREYTGVDIQLIKASELEKYEHIDFPFHPAYKFLSYNHRSDYLRCYFMHVYGGAYSDIKKNRFNWNDCFDRLNKSEKWILGYPEIAPSGVASQNEKLKMNYFRLIGNGCFICKPQTPLTKEWYGIVKDLLDANLEKLKKNPGNMWGDNAGYPLRWAEVQGELFHPLIYKYRNFILYDNRMRLNFANYK